MSYNSVKKIRIQESVLERKEGRKEGKKEGRKGGVCELFLMVECQLINIKQVIEF